MALEDAGIRGEPIAAEITGRADAADSGAAFAELVAAHHARLARLAYLLCSDRQQAEDAVSEAYAKVWPRFRKGRIDNPPQYLRTAVVNQVRGGLRRRLLERREEQRQRVDWRAGTAPERNVEEREVLEPALARLPAPQRAVIVLRYYEDLSEEDTANLLGIPAGTVKSRCTRGLEQLRRLVGATDG